MKLCKDCRFFLQESGDMKICTRPYPSNKIDYVCGHHVMSAPINDLCVFQRQKISFCDWLDGRRPPKVGYCGPKARFFEKKTTP